MRTSLQRSSKKNKMDVGRVVAFIGIFVGTFLVAINFNQVLNEVGAILVGSSVPVINVPISPILYTIAFPILLYAIIKIADSLRSDMWSHAKSVNEAAAAEKSNRQAASSIEADEDIGVVTTDISEEEVALAS